jgi:kumamolisin
MAASSRKVFHDSIIPLPDETGLTPMGLMVNATVADHKTDLMTVLFSLDIPAATQTSIEERVAKGEVIPEAELEAAFRPNEDHKNSLIKWLKANHFEVEATEGTSIYAKATVSQIEKSLMVNMVRVTKGGMTYTAAQNAPSLPADVGSSVHAIIGLQPFRQFQKHSVRFIPATDSPLSFDRGKSTAKAVKGRKTAKKAAPAAASAAMPNSPPYLVSELLKTYNADALSVTGAGQTIGILIDTFPSASDLAAFWKKNGLAIKPSQIQMINVNSATLPPPSGEETLDASWASGIAPGAKVKIYASGTLRFVDLDKALNRILADSQVDPSLRQVSISLGLGETYMGGPNGEVRTQHMKYLQLSARGVNVFVSSGDAGSNPDSSGHSSTGPTQAEYASSDTSVIGVGGTSLKLKANGDVASETGWPGSGGGKSILFSRPVWQVASGMPVGQERLVPDVSLVADPNTGAFLVLNGKPMQIGGTSWSAPVWAAFCALINEARIKAGKAALPFLNPLIYPLAGKTPFRDITAGSNGAFSAAKGFDLVTGLGVPNVKELIRQLP